MERSRQSQDSTARQIEVYLRAKQRRQEAIIPALRIGARDGRTGQYKVIRPSGSESSNGVKVFNSSAAVGTIVRPTQAVGQPTIALDYKNVAPNRQQQTTVVEDVYTSTILFTNRNADQGVQGFLEFWVGGSRPAIQLGAFTTRKQYEFYGTFDGPFFGGTWTAGEWVFNYDYLFDDYPSNSEDIHSLRMTKTLTGDTYGYNASAQNRLSFEVTQDTDIRLAFEGNVAFNNAIGDGNIEISINQEDSSSPITSLGESYGSGSDTYYFSADTTITVSPGRHLISVNALSPQFDPSGDLTIDLRVVIDIRKPVYIIPLRFWISATPTAIVAGCLMFPKVVNGISYYGNLTYYQNDFYCRLALWRLVGDTVEYQEQEVPINDHSNPPSITGFPDDDWQQSLVSFALAPDPAGDACIDAYRSQDTWFNYLVDPVANPIANANIYNGKLYRLDPAQGSPDFDQAILDGAITATITVATVTSDMTCTTGPTKNLKSKVKQCDPGYGEQRVVAIAPTFSKKITTTS